MSAYLKDQSGEYVPVTVINKFIKKEGVWVPAYRGYIQHKPWSKCDAPCGENGHQTREVTFVRRVMETDKVYTMDTRFHTSDVDVTSKRSCRSQSCQHVSKFHTNDTFGNAYINTWTPPKEVLCSLTNECQKEGVYEVNLSFYVSAKLMYWNNQLHNTNIYRVTCGDTIFTCTAGCGHCNVPYSEYTHDTFEEKWKCHLSVTLPLSLYQRNIPIMCSIYESSLYSNSGIEGCNDGVYCQ